MRNEAVIIGAARTPVGKFNGALATVPAVDLGALAIAAALNRAHVKPNEVDELLMGSVLSAGLGQNPARQSAIAAGLPETVPSATINKVCGSGLKTVALAAQSIILGEAEVVVAGGMENMSAAPYLIPKPHNKHLPQPTTLLNDAAETEAIDSMVSDGLWCALSDCHMAITAENVARDYMITRSAQDTFAVESHHKAAYAWESGLFDEEIVPVSVPQETGNPLIMSRDEHFRANVSLEKLAALKPVFAAGGNVTAGNASGINDGAAAVVITSREKASRLGVEPLAAIRAYASVGVPPHIMGIGPVPAVKKVLAKSGLTLADINLIEANEAFAAQTLAVGQALDWNWDQVNVNGGAIALGHPIGASGCRILVTLLHELRRRHEKLGLATLCIGGGQGIAMIVER